MKHLRPIEEKKPKGAPDWHDSDAPDANGRFRDLSIKDLAAWLIKTRKKDVKRISGSLTQQIVFNRNDDPKYAEKMEKTRKEVYKQLGREDLLESKREDVGKYNTVKKVIKELGRRPSEQELATFITNNYYDVTEVERGEDDPAANDKIADLVAFYKFDIEDWNIAWFDAQNESVVTESNDETGLMIIGRTRKDNNEIGEVLDDLELHGEWDMRAGFWFLPEEEEMFDELESMLDKEFTKRKINARFEGVFESVVTESIRVGKVVAIKKYNAKTNRKEVVDVRVTDYIKKPGSKDFVEYDLKGKKRKVSIDVFKSMIAEGKFNVNEGMSKERMIKQIERALKDGLSIFKLPMATQTYYRKHKSDFETVEEGNYKMEDIYDLIAHHRFDKDFEKLSSKDKEWVKNDAKERGFNESLLESDMFNMYYSLIDELYEAKPGPDAYMTGLSDEEKEEKEAKMKKQADMDDDDPDSYEELPGDEEAREKGKVKKSKHTTAYNKKFKGESMKNLKSFDNFVTEKKSDLWSPFQKADVLAGDMFGAMGLYRLEDDELDQIIDLKKADKLAKKMFGEFGFKTLAAKEMEDLLDNNPKLLRESMVTETNDLVDRIGDLDDILMSDRKAEREWEEMSQNYLDGQRGSEYWGDLGDQELQDAIDDAESLMKKYRIKESVNEKILLIMKDVISKMVGAGFSYRTDPKMRDEIYDAISKVIVPILKDYGYAIKESKESDELAIAINDAIIDIDDSMSYKDFAEAVAKVIKDEYGSHLYKPFQKQIERSLKESVVNEEKIKYAKGKTYQSSGHYTVMVDSNSSMCDIRVNHSAGWRLDPHDDREETWELLDGGRQRATIYFRRGSIDKFAQQMFDLNDRTTWGNKTKLTAKDYADIIRLWIDMKKANESRNTGIFSDMVQDFEDSVKEKKSLNEAKLSTVHRAAKKGSYPAVIVVVQDGKVIHQEPVSTPEVAPATFNVMQKEYPKALLHLEDKTGKRLFSESVVTEALASGSKIEKNLNKALKANINMFGDNDETIKVLDTPVRIERSQYDKEMNGRSKNFEASIMYMYGSRTNEYDTSAVIGVISRTKGTAKVFLYSEETYNQFAKGASFKEYEGASVLEEFQNKTRDIVSHLSKFPADGSANESVVTEAESVEVGEYIKTQYGYFYKRVDGKVGGQEAFVEIKKGKEGKRKTSIHDTVSFEIVDAEEALNENRMLRKGQFRFGAKLQYGIEDVNESYGFYGTLMDQFGLDEVNELFLDGFAVLETNYDFTDQAALYYLNSKAGRWVADQVTEKLIGPKNMSPYYGHLEEIFAEYAKKGQWKKWAKEYDQFAEEDNMEEGLMIRESKSDMDEYYRGLLEAEQTTNDQSPLGDDGMETGIKNKAKESGVPVGLLRIIMRRGLAAWKTGHRPGATQAQWGYARVNSFLTKQPGTWGKADSDIAKKVRDGGHDKNL